MIKTVLISLGLLFVIVVAGVLILAATGPDTFRVERSTTIQAPPETIFAILNDFQMSQSWSPYEKKDPAMRRSFSGPASGLGAVYEFEGNKEVGTGRLEITDSTSPSKVAMTLDMVKPFEVHNVIEYTLVPVGASTNVTWALNGRCPFPAKIMGVFFDMDRMIGTDFEAGLADLKSLAENERRTHRRRRSRRRKIRGHTGRERSMKFMIIVKATKDSEAGVTPSEKLLAEMGKFNEELVEAGVALAGEGLHPTSKGARVRFSGAKRMVIDGPFAETRELIAGFWLWQVKSLDEAIAWVKRCPNPHDEETEVEIRQLFAADDFGEAFTPELREQEQRLRAKMEAKK